MILAIEKTIDSPKNDKKHNDSKDSNNNFFLAHKKTPLQQTFAISYREREPVSNFQSIYC